MAGDPSQAKAASQVEDVVPELHTRLLLLRSERERCLKYAGTLSSWSLFWRSSLITVGAQVAAQGAFVKVWGNAGWVTVAFIFFGAFTAAGTGINAFFKPGERSPKFAGSALTMSALRRLVCRGWTFDDKRMSWLEH
jgi:hypothetical protein